jgi:hypothetical protein
MELRDLIRQDSDRLFILDSECYIIFTGDTVEDEKPFIRIGNWINLPVELIPLIENIIITDLIVGNPSHEQFNIDVNYLSTNRYIGSELIVKRYLDFQKAFGLDLTNATIVDIEKDIPVVSRRKILSDEDSFIGIFYTDGNFRITHRKNNIFNLKEVKEKNLHAIRVHDLLSERSRESSRYAGSGLVFIENNPFFYRKGLFTSYHFPRNYYEAFARLSIDPAQIRDLILPSSNVMNITRLLKWKHRTKGRTRLFSDFREDIDLLARLYSGATTIRAGFQGMSFDTGEGLGIRNYPGTFNLRLNYKKVRPSQQDVSVAYIKGSGGIPDIIREPLDAVIVSYPVYEEAALLFKGTAAPVIVAADTPQAAARLAGRGIPFIRRGVQYEFLKYGGAESLLGDISQAMTNRDLQGLVNEESVEKLPESLKSFAYASPFDAMKDAQNLLALLRVNLHTTASRKYSALISKAISGIERSAGRESLYSDHGAALRSCLAFMDGSLFEYVVPIAKENASPLPAILDEITDDPAELPAGTDDREFRAHCERIRDDRRRLQELLKLFRVRKDAYREITALREAIEKKKERYQADFSSPEDAEIKKTVWRIRLRKAAKYILFPLLAAVLVIGTYGGFRAYRHYRETQKAEAERRFTENLIKKYKIRVADTDIFVYVNQVAVKNGYAPIAYRAIRERNPNWIYPGNIFYMLDGEKIIVKPGDTLWGISHRKLMKRHLDFYEALQKIEEGLDKGADMRKEIARAEGLAFSDEHRSRLKKLTAAPGR